MKKIIKNRWFPLIAAVAILLLAAGVVFTMLLHGWRLTYAPDLETDWDAVSAVAAWGGVITSFWAICFAILVPKTIANRQDSISLFEKRFACYIEMQKFIASAVQMKNLSTKHSVQTAFRIYFDNPEEIVENKPGTFYILLLTKKEAEILAGEFLFPNFGVKLAQEIVNTATELIRLVATSSKSDEPLSEEAIKYRNQYYELCKKYEQTYIELIEQELYNIRKK